MNNLFDSVKTNFSKLPKWAWVGIIAGFLLVVYFSNKNKSAGVTYAPAPAYDEPNFETNKVSESEVANRINTVVSDLNEKMVEGLNEQGSYFNQIISEQEQRNQDQLNSYNDGFEERTSALTSVFNEKNTALENQLTEVTTALSGATAEIQKLSEPQPVPPKVWQADSFKTGTFGDINAANNVAKTIRESYGGQNVQVVNEGGSYRVVSNFSQDEGKAERVQQRLQERGLIRVGYVENG